MICDIHISVHSANFKIIRSALNKNLYATSNFCFLHIHRKKCTRSASHHDNEEKYIKKDDFKWTKRLPDSIFSFLQTLKNLWPADYWKRVWSVQIKLPMHVTTFWQQQPQCNWQRTDGAFSLYRDITTSTSSLGLLLNKSPKPLSGSESFQRQFALRQIRIYIKSAV